MTINITNINNVETISKPWGHEKWIADGAPDFKYALKEIFFKSKNKSSIQFHEFKEETTYVQKGKGILHYSEDPIDFLRYNNNGYTPEEIENLISNMKKIEINPGTIYHIKPGIIHQVEAIEDLLFIESSTIELDDVIRFKDQWGRNNGIIKDEHKKFLLPGNFYHAQVERLKFVQKYTGGRVLFCSYGVNTQYFASKLLLDSGSKEIWHYNSANMNENIGIRKWSQKQYVDYDKGPNINEISEKKFDCILSFEEIQYQKNPLSVIKLYNKLLKDKGVLILSTINKAALSSYFGISTEMHGFSKDDLLKILKDDFPNITKFSQRNISNLETTQRSFRFIDNIFSKIKTSSKKILQSVDKNENFYKLHLQKTALKLRSTKEQFSEKILDISFIPIPYHKSHNPLNIILLCKK